MSTASSLAWKTSLRKSQDAVALQQIKERGALPMIDRGDIRQKAIDRCSNISGLMVGAGYGQFEHKADSLIAKFSKGRNGQRDWCMSRVTAIISALVICIIVCLSWAVNHYRDNAITYKAQRQKCQRTEAGDPAITDMVMRQRDVAALDAKYTKELADAKAEMMLMGHCRWSSSVAHQSSLSIKAWSYPLASGVDNAASPWLADTAERDYFTLRERLITMQKQLKNQKYINEQCR